MNTSTQPTLALIWHPARKHSERARRQIVERARETGWAVQVHPTTVEHPGGTQASQALADRVDLVVIAGGDGTVREVAAVVAGTGIPLGIVPIGTANLFARNLGLRPRRLITNINIALSGMASAVDLGRVDLITATGTPQTGLPFLVMAGIGHDAATVAATTSRAKRRWGWLAYLAAGAPRLFARAMPMTYASDGESARRIQTWTVLAGNCGRIPGGIPVFPNARFDDGVLDILQVPLIHPLQWCGVAAKGLFRIKSNVQALRYTQAHRIEVEPKTPQPVQLDGDVVADVIRFQVSLQAGALVVKQPNLGLSKRVARLDTNTF